jgi:pimeloyl-ACP methyl ester carboxylesterase
MKKLNKRILSTILLLLAMTLSGGCSLTVDPENERVKAMNGSTLVESGYVPVNGLNMYYEIHGEGEPLVLLHGGLTSIDISFGAMIPTLAKSRKLIAIEQQGHGRTADIDRPLSFTQMAEDTIALLQQLGIEQADFFGYSDGGNVAIGIAISQPQMVRKLAIAGTNYNNEGVAPEIIEFMRTASAEALGPEMEAMYAAVAPNPEDWPIVVEKVMKLGAEFEGWPSEDIAAIQSPTLIVIGDADIVLPEHAVEMYRLFPHANLAVLPATDHFLRLQDPVWLLSMVEDFFNAPMPATE